jgi:uncharacterized membrane protein
MSDSLRGAIYGLTAAAIWGGMYVVSDVVLATIPPFTLLSIRLIMGIAVLGLLLLRRGDRLPPRADLLRLLGVGLVGFGVSVGAQFVGTDKSTAVNGTLITSASPAFILIFAALLLREKLSIQRIAAVGLATVGVIVIIDLANAQFGSDTFFGDVALAVAALTWGLYSVLVRQVSATYDTLLVSVCAFIGVIGDELFCCWEDRRRACRRGIERANSGVTREFRVVGRVEAVRTENLAGVASSRELVDEDAELVIDAAQVNRIRREGDDGLDQAFEVGTLFRAFKTQDRDAQTFGA